MLTIGRQFGIAIVVACCIISVRVQISLLVIIGPFLIIYPSISAYQVTCPTSPKRTHSGDSHHSSDSHHSDSESESHAPFVPRSSKRNAQLYPNGIPPNPEHGSSSQHPHPEPHPPFQPRPDKRNAKLYPEGVEHTRSHSPASESGSVAEHEHREHNRTPFNRPGSTGTFGGGHHGSPEPEPPVHHREPEPNRHRPLSTGTFGTGSPNTSPRTSRAG